VLLYTVADHQLHAAELHTWQQGRSSKGIGQPSGKHCWLRCQVLLLLLLLLCTCADSSELWQSFSKLLRRSEAGHPAAKHSASRRFDLPHPLGPVIPTSWWLGTSSVVVSANDLNALRASCDMCHCFGMAVVAANVHHNQGTDLPHVQLIDARTFG
jgi:hypothetical protein